MANKVVIPWSADPETNRRNIQEAIDNGATVINGERDENGDPRVYPIAPMSVSEA
jgi:hypothetical protein